MNDLTGVTLLDRYVVRQLLGRGGMAEVYLVWDNVRAVPLAMKLLREDLAEDKVFLRRFRREAQNLAKLQHPHIVRSYGLERDGDHSFLLMDYVEGTTLRKEVFRSEGSLPQERILEIMRPVCSALHYAHQTGVIHCDAKPANIMIDKGGRIFMTDFGIARLTDAATVTMVGAGTPAYMSPEQIKGAEPTAQTDIYALGVVLFEMLTGGERPFTGERSTQTGSTAEMVRWEKLNLEPPSPSKWNPSLTSELEAVVLKCLHQDPAKRYASTLELLGALETQILSAGPAIEDDEITIIDAPVIPKTKKLPEIEPKTVSPEIEEAKKPDTSDSAIGSQTPAAVEAQEQLELGSNVKKVFDAVPPLAWLPIGLIAFLLFLTLLPNLAMRPQAAEEPIQAEVFEEEPVEEEAMIPEGALLPGDIVVDEVNGPLGDSWPLFVTVGTVVDLRMHGTGGFDPYLELLDPSGESMATDDYGGPDDDSWLIAPIRQTGTYTIVARGAGGALGSYRLMVEENTDGFPGSIGSGQAVTETLTETIDFHVWSFVGDAGQSVSIAMDGLDGLDTYLELFSPNGILIEDDDDDGSGADAFIERELLQSGTYFIIARGFSGSIGSYRLTFDTTGVGDHADGLGVGMTVDDEVTNASGDSWELYLTEGDIVEIRMDGEDEFDAYIEILDPSGERFLADDDSGPGRDPWAIVMVPQTGTYTLIARGYDGDTGNYVLSVEDISNAYQGEVQPSRSETENLTENQPFQIWSFEGDAGQIYSISMQEVDGMDTYLELLGPNGTRIERDDDGGADFNSFIIREMTQSGTYYIITRGFSDQIGSYQLTLESLGTSSALDLLEFGELVRDEVTNSTGDQWSVLISNGGVIDIRMDGSDGFDTYLELFHSDGNRVAANDSSGPGRDSWLIAYIQDAGLYTIVARGDDGERGSYSLSAHEMPDAVQDEISPGQTVSDTLTSVLEFHIWWFEGEAGQTISISLEGMEGLDTYLELWTVDWELIDRDDDGGNNTDSFIERRLPESGTYVIVVRGFSRDLGGYRLTLD